MANVTVTVQSQTQTIATTNTTTTTTITTGTRQAGPSFVCKKEFAKSDSTLPFRLVGSYEYLNAIDFIEKLAAMSDAQEISVYDDIIETQRELSFVCGIATDYGLIRVSDLPEAEQSLIESTYKRHSLAWLLALARVEVGATISMYGYSQDPFGVFANSSFGRDEYLEILTDDLTNHLKTVANDQGFQNANLQKLDSDTLAYLRRAKLMNDLLDKIMLTGNNELVSAAEPYSNDVNKYIDGLVKRIRSVQRRKITLNPIESFRSESSTTESSTELQTESRQETRFKSIRFINREGLLACQRALEQRYPSR